MRLLSLISGLLAAGAYGAALPRGAVDASSHTLVSRNETVNATAEGYWLADIPKQGIAAFNQDPGSYRVFRNVKDYGAVGDGVTDDSAAINRAISEQNRCGPWVCDSSTDTPAVIYFPSGTYMIANPIIMYYMTQLHGNPNDLPILKASPNLQALALIDASPYNPEDGEAGWISTNLFARQIRNFVIDGTAVPPTNGFQGIHWPTSQATSIQNVKIRMNQDPNSVHAGIFVENGSGGWMVDIEIEGGLYGMNVGNQQFTMRGIKISKAVVGISQIWNWGWLYQDLTISDCETAFSMENGVDSGTLQVGSVVIIDSQITNCQTFVNTAWTRNSEPRGAGQLILENINLSNVPVAVRGADSSTVLAGGTTTISAWGQGNKYTPEGPEKFQGPIQAAQRPASLLDGNKFYTKSKPQYGDVPLSSFISARSAGATGDGRTDDTVAVQNAINDAAASNRIVFFDHGVYKVTNTITIPPGARMVGETFSVIMAAGGVFSDINNPVPVMQIGRPGDAGSIEWSDMIVATQGGTAGAVLIQWNLKAQRGSGLWDVHTRIGGAKGTNLQVAQCPKFSVLPECFAAYMSVHVTPDAEGAYMENNWFWTADHDLDDPTSTQISIFTGRGLLVESPTTWLYGNGVEHHSLYQYHFVNARDIFAGYIQTETAYWMPVPDARDQPFPLNPALSDPDYRAACPAGQPCSAYGLRILDSQNVRIYAGGLYSFFDNYDVSCSAPEAPDGRRDCQNRIFSIEGPATSSVQAFGFSEVGALEMLTVDGRDVAGWEPNLSVYANTIAWIAYRI